LAPTTGPHAPPNHLPVRFSGLKRQYPVTSLTSAYTVAASASMNNTAVPRSGELVIETGRCTEQTLRPRARDRSGLQIRGRTGNWTLGATPGDFHTLRVPREGMRLAATSATMGNRRPGQPAWVTDQPREQH